MEKQENQMALLVIMANVGSALRAARATCLQMLSVGLAQGEWPNHDTVLGARNGVDVSGPSLGLAMGWVLSHIPFALAFL